MTGETGARPARESMDTFSRFEILVELPWLMVRCPSRLARIACRLTDNQEDPGERNSMSHEARVRWKGPKLMFMCVASLFLLGYEKLDNNTMRRTICCDVASRDGHLYHG